MNALRPILATGVLSWMFLAGLPALAGDKLAAEAEKKIELAYHRGDANTIESTNRELDSALEKAPNDPALLYTRAFGHYAHATILPPAERQRSTAELERALELLEKIKGEPWEAEAAGLQANMLGMLIGLKGGTSAMTLGPRSHSALERAKAAQPNNPRVLMFEGISLLNRPAAFGGSAEKGAETLARAAEQFSRQKTSAPGATWGHADALMWLGMARQKLGDIDGARAAWKEALQMDPGWQYIETTLLASLQPKQ